MTAPLVATTIDTMANAYPDLRANESWVSNIIANEEGSFRPRSSGA